eukprot:sb/3478667/
MDLRIEKQVAYNGRRRFGEWDLFGTCKDTRLKGWREREKERERDKERSLDSEEGVDAETVNKPRVLHVYYIKRSPVYTSLPDYNAPHKPLATSISVIQ